MDNGTNGRKEARILGIAWGASPLVVGLVVIIIESISGSLAYNGFFTEESLGGWVALIVMLLLPVLFLYGLVRKYDNRSLISLVFSTAFVTFIPSVVLGLGTGLLNWIM